MDKEKILLGASVNIDTIKAHINRLKKPGYKIHSLDIDMLKSKAYELYEQILSLEDMASGVSITQPEIVTDEIEKPVEVVKEEKISEQESIVVEVANPEPATDQKIDEELPKESKTDILEEIEKYDSDHPVTDEFEDVNIEETEELEPDEEAIIEDKPEDKKETIIPEPEVPETKPEKKENTTAYDLFSGSAEKPVAERLTNKDETSIADKMQKSQIANIREAIGINDKFLFINELFHGDMSRYNKILDDINSMTTKKGVDTFLLELKIQSQWNDDNEAYIRFREIIDRKFS